MHKKPLAKKLNLACGDDIKKGWVNMDVVALPGVDTVWDFNKIPWPFPANHFTEVLANHAIEHVDDLITIMNEIYRVTKKGAQIKILVPYFASPHSHSDPTHKQWFTSRTFNYFRPGHYYTPKANFDILKKKIIFLSNAGYMRSKWYSWPIDFCINLILPFYERFFPYIFPASEIHFLLRTKKK